MKLTRAEEQIMQILWSLNEATVQEIRDEFEEKSKPARTTIATVLSILETKNIVEHTTEGRNNKYRAKISKKSYSKKQLSGFIERYFDGSFASLASFFAKENNLSIEDLNKVFEETRATLKKDDDHKQT
jgi:predicted transcriptional regulator